MQLQEQTTKRALIMLLTSVITIAALALDFSITEKTWTFDSVTNVVQSNKVQNLGGIYYQGGSNSCVTKLGSAASGTFSDGCRWQTSQPFTLTGNAFKDSYLTGKRRMAGVYSSSFSKTLAFNISTPGTCYVVMKTVETPVNKEDSFGLHFQYAGFEAQWTYRSCKKPLTDQITELKLTADTKGTFWISTNQKAHIYAVRFVPSTNDSILIAKNIQQPGYLRKISDSIWFADYERDAFGQIELRLSGNEGDSVTVHLGECILNGHIDRNPGGTRRYKALGIRLKQGIHTYRPAIPADKRNTGAKAVHIPMEIGEVLPFRYVEIEGYDGLLAEKDVIRYTYNYRFNDDASYFRCSDDTLNQIWDLCKYSIKATSFAGYYVDGDRERIPYEADALINQLGHYANDCDFTLARRTFDWLMRNPTWPTEWQLQMVLVAWNDYLFSGDTTLISQWADKLRGKTLEAFRHPETGLVTTRAIEQTPERLITVNRNGKLKDIVDWPHGSEDDGFEYTDYNAVVNAYHYEAVKCMAKIYKALGRIEEQKEMEKYCCSFRKLFNNSFLDADKGIYRDGVESSHYSMHSNMFALCFGLVPEERVKSVTDYIVSRGMACSVYGSQFLLDALYEGGNGRAAYKLLTSTAERSWWNMIREGSTISMEAWGNKFKPNQDWNHAWGAAPASIIPFRLMGIRPTAPGFSRAEIRPQTAFLKHADCRVPTIKGAISANIQRTDKAYTLIVDIPEGILADVYLPLESNAYTLFVDDIRTSAISDERGFVYAAKAVSGIHKFELRYSMQD